jgi:hypothetical protein
MKRRNQELLWWEGVNWKEELNKYFYEKASAISRRLIEEFPIKIVLRVRQATLESYSFLRTWSTEEEKSEHRGIQDGKWQKWQWFVEQSKVAKPSFFHPERSLMRIMILPLIDDMRDEVIIIRVALSIFIEISKYNWSCIPHSKFRR